MPRLLLFPTAAMLLALTACTSQDEPAPAEELPAQAESADDPDPSGVPEQATAEQRRQQLREQMAQHREDRMETDSSPDSEQRQRMREGREQAGQWWHDPALVEALSLSEGQIRAIDSAAAERRTVARQARSEMTRLRRQSRDDHASGSDGQAVRDWLAEANRQWLDSLHEILDQEQLTALEAQHPEVLSPPQTEAR